MFLFITKRERDNIEFISCMVKRSRVFDGDENLEQE
jgi:hypothetical protein